MASTRNGRSAATATYLQHACHAKEHRRVRRIHARYLAISAVEESQHGTKQRGLEVDANIALRGLLHAPRQEGAEIRGSLAQHKPECSGCEPCRCDAVRRATQ